MFQSVIEQRVAAAEDAVRTAVADLDPDAIPAREAVRLFEALERIVRRASAARTLLLHRVDDSMEWRRRGFRSAAEFVASRSGTSLAAARTEMETSEALRALPATRERLLDGSLSADQGATIAGAAKVNPGAEQELIHTAGTANLNELREQAQRAKAAADPDPAATHARLHRERRGTRPTDAEGARLLHLRGPADLAAVLEAELDRLTDRIFRERGKAGTLECRDAYVYDAAVEMARRSARADEATPAGRPQGRRPEHLALLRLDVAALRRGWVDGDELCEITGIGPIPVEVARRLLGDAVLKLVLTKGVDVANVTSLTRRPTQAMRYAHLWTSPTCTVEGCSRTIVEYDHVQGAEYRHTRHTRLDETAPVCPGHHDLHTFQGWALLPGPGKRPMVPPTDPRHPAHHGPAPPAPPGTADPPPEPRGDATVAQSRPAQLFADPAA